MISKGNRTFRNTFNHKRLKGTIRKKIVKVKNTFSMWLCVCVCVCVKLLESCPTLCNPMDHSPGDFSVHRILQA